MSYIDRLREHVGSSERQKDLAERIGKTPAAVSRYANRKRWPDSQTARAIDEATEGAVPFSLWQEEMMSRLGIAA